MLSEQGDKLTPSNGFAKCGAVLEGKAFLNLQFGIQSLAPFKTREPAASISKREREGEPLLG